MSRKKRAAKGVSRSNTSHGTHSPPVAPAPPHATIVLSIPSGYVRYVRSLFRFAELVGEVERTKWTPSQKLARAEESRAKEPPKEALDEVTAILEKQEWQRRFLAAEKASRPFQRLNLPTWDPTWE